VAMRVVEKGVELKGMSVSRDIRRGEKVNRVETFGAGADTQPEDAQPGVGEGMADWLDPEMVGWRAPSAAWGVPPELWSGLCSRFVSRVLEGREAIEKGVEINWGGWWAFGRGGKINRVEPFGARAGTQPEDAQPWLEEGMADCLDPEMVGWRAPPADWGVPPKLWSGLCSRFVIRVLEGREAIKNGVEIIRGGCVQNQGNRQWQ